MPNSLRILSLLLVLSFRAFAETTPGSVPAQDRTLKVMTFNIRNSSAKDGANHWTHRKDLFVSTIRTFDPDLLGLQEVLADQYDDLHTALPDYTPIGVAREDGVRKGEWAEIMYRTSRFDQIDSGNFWLSEQPEAVGSKGWDASYVRICTWVRLRDHVTGKELLHANTHFDNNGKVARVKSAELIDQRLPALSKGAPIILTGDFNSSEDSEAYKALLHPQEKSENQLFDSYREIHPERSSEEASFHGFKGTILGSRIDWILHTQAFKPFAAEIVRSAPGERFASDHYAVTAIFKLP
jgi:endonuclease/exonuclease/phosphatase family metal-dependent hydrolase